ncbi:MAG: imidazoleglycerol-phosphate dehydratase HisB [bacterium]
MKREAKIKRKTNETEIDLSLAIDGQGESHIETGIGFFDHMLTLFSKHGLFDLDLRVKGDLEIDAHHSVEDTGLCLGKAFHDALGDCAGIRRFASVLMPMDDALTQLVIDISNRPYLAFDVEFNASKVGDFDVELMQEFFQAFVNNARINLHIKLLAGQNQHHVIESGFKALGLCLDQATGIDPRKKGVPSTKGIL